MPQAQRWEYTFLTHDAKGIVSSYVDEERAEELNALGNDGWELVAAIPVTEKNGALYRVTYVFKRPQGRVA